MYYLSLIGLFILIIYIGQVLGYIAQSYNIKLLKYTRGKLSIFIPLMSMWMVFYLLKQKNKRRFRLALYYIFCFKNKSLAIGTVVSYLIEEYRSTHPQASINNIKRYIPTVNAKIASNVIACAA